MSIDFSKKTRIAHCKCIGTKRTDRRAGTTSWRVKINPWTSEPNPKWVCYNCDHEIRMRRVTFNKLMNNA